MENISMATQHAENAIAQIEEMPAEDDGAKVIRDHVIEFVETLDQLAVEESA